MFSDRGCPAWGLSYNLLLSVWRVREGGKRYNWGSIVSELQVLFLLFVYLALLEIKESCFVSVCPFNPKCSFKVYKLSNFILMVQIFKLSSNSLSQLSPEFLSDLSLSCFSQNSEHTSKGRQGLKYFVLLQDENHNIAIMMCIHVTESVLCARGREKTDGSKEVVSCLWIT